MTKRTITDHEIALIKAMLAQGMKNNDIQFLFNRPDRPVNSGRITGIRDGTYGPSKKITAASKTDLDAFMVAHPGGAAPAVGRAPEAADGVGADPLAEGIVSTFFKQGADGRWRLVIGETDIHECKTNFRLKYPSVWLRAIAALANNAGGYVFFGVHDKGASDEAGNDLSHVAIGMKSEEFAKMDPADLTKKVKSVFDPTPRVRSKLLAVGGTNIGVIHVERHESRPVIATKNEGDDVREGEIYFRYSGQSARIKYSDLRTLLDARDRHARSQILPMVERLLQLGPHRTMIADLAEGTLGDGKYAFQLDDALIQKLTFIKEGEFSEIEGAPTLRLIGEVQTSGGQLPAKLGLLTRDSVIEAFLDQAATDDPERYIRFAVEVSQGEWYPLHYFARLAGMSRDDLVAFIEGANATPKRKETYIKRVKPSAAYSAPVGTPRSYLAKLLAGEMLAAVTEKEAGAVCQAIEGLPDNHQVEAPAMLWLLKQCNHLLKGKTAQSYARRAICRVDELLFADA